jgi:TetR/AcrR family transcriptional regulator of autoinduction and epiphytic fitness
VLQEPAIDRRAALKNRHRQAIVDAAAALMDERSGTDFTVEEIAERADVSRRTVFNHFASLDDVVVEVCSGALGTVIESLASVDLGDGTNASTMEEMADVLRAADLVGPLAYLTRVLGLPHDQPSPRQALMTLRVFTEVSSLLSAAILLRRPGADRLALDLLVGSLAGGVGVLYHHWATETGAIDTPGSRQVWSRHLERLIQSVRDGHCNEPPAQATA